MAHAYYSEIHLHLVWHTKHNEPYLTDDVESEAHAAIRLKALETKGVIVHAIGGTANHVHLAVTVPPSVRVSDFVGQMKGASSHKMGVRFPDRPFAWQTGYGVVSFGTRAMGWVVAYVENQKAHHAGQTAHDRLERTEELEPPETPET
ncbi:MAG: IS200/IS605 family transposase, partial [Gemmataceae bacterium]